MFFNMFNTRPAISKSGMMAWGAPSPSTAKCKPPAMLMSGTSATTARNASLLPHAEIGRARLFPKPSNMWGLHPACVAGFPGFLQIKEWNYRFEVIWGNAFGVLYPGYPTFIGCCARMVLTLAITAMFLRCSFFMITCHIWLVVSTPLKNISQLGWLFPIYGKIIIIHVPNTQPDMFVWWRITWGGRIGRSELACVHIPGLTWRPALSDRGNSSVSLFETLPESAFAYLLHCFQCQHVSREKLPCYREGANWPVSRWAKPLQRCC